MVNKNLCDSDPDAISIIRAQMLIENNANIVNDTELLPIRNALGRVLREDAISLVNNPPNDNSAMDGYGVKFEDCLGDNIELSVIGTSFAGNPFVGEIKRGESIRIMTGAPIPNGVNAVVMQEQTEFNNKTNIVTINSKVENGQNIRRQGEDVSINQIVIKSGTILTPACIGVLATMGISEVLVTRKINVVIMSTGDELQSVGSILKTGNIYDSNRYSLYSLLCDPRFNIIDKGILSDNRGDIESTFLDVSSYADIIISTGGVSVGEADWVKDCIKEKGELIFWKVSIKPGRPIAFGRLNKCLFFGLPGNPVSVMICFEKFTKIALQVLSGQKLRHNIRIKARLLSNIRKRPGRTEFQRGVIHYDVDGELTVKTTGEQGSGILSSMSVANCIIVLDNDDESKYKGDLVFVEPFSVNI